ncbi:MAG TPA: alpha/beta hydrolase [Gemmataceae bacterium]|nr:alpha/beta hydrolase [Gemmataceae bacterium]
MSRSAIFLRGLALVVSIVAVGCASTRSRSVDRSRLSNDHSRPQPTPASPTPPAPPLIPPLPPTLPAPAATAPVHKEIDVIYGTGGGEQLKLDLYAPKDRPGPFPAVVVIHGGGWANGTKGFLGGITHAFAERGYVAVTVEYRLAPKHKFPAQLQDVKCAVRWLRANAQRYQIDPDRIGALGFSSGAHLALLLGLTEPKDGFEGEGGHLEQSSKVQVVVNMMGPTDLSRPAWPAVTDKLIADLLGGGREQIPSVYRAASPLAYVHRGAPPVLTMHGTKDAIVPFEQAKLLHASLRSVRGISRLEPVKDKGHGEDWSREELLRGLGLIGEFMDKYLKPR